MPPTRENASSVPPPSGRRRHRAAVAAVLAILLLAALEAASFIALALLLGGVPSLAQIRRDRALLARSAALDAGTADLAAADAGELARGLGQGGRELIQPYLGFTWDPATDLTQDRFLFKLRVGSQGFLQDQTGAWSSPGAGPPLRVGVFGGSVAGILVLAGHRPLLRNLGTHPDLAGHALEIRSFALPGYKQPQQLNALTWLFTLGEELDAVVNVDGFNEVALPAAENLPRGVHPLYPRRWDQRTEGLADLDAQLAAGEVAYLRLHRGEVAAAFDRPAVGWSPTWNLLWLHRDRRLAAAETAALGRAQAPLETGGFLAHGPVFDTASAGGDFYPQLAAAWARASLQMHQICTARGIPYHHFLQPNQYVPGSKPLTTEERTRFTRDDHPYRAAVLGGYPELRRQGEELRRAGVAFHDLTGLFADEERTVYSDDCCHMNAYGNRRLAEAVAAALADDLAAVAAAR